MGLRQHHHRLYAVPPLRRWLGRRLHFDVRHFGDGGGLCIWNRRRLWIFSSAMHHPHAHKHRRCDHA